MPVFKGLSVSLDPENLPGVSGNGAACLDQSAWLAPSHHGIDSGERAETISGSTCLN